MNLIISDLDNTLGYNNDQILYGMTQIASYQNACDICFITGRSFTALDFLVDVITEGIFISPWGGGNLLEAKGNREFSFSAALKIYVPNIDFSKNTRFILIPKEESLLCSKEKIATKEEFYNLQPFYNCVGAFEQVLESQSHNRGLNGTFWNLHTPWKNPRLRLVEELRTKYESIIYIGDDIPDQMCIDQVDFFFAPEKSIISYDSRVSLFNGINSLMNLIETLIK